MKMMFVLLVVSMFSCVPAIAEDNDTTLRTTPAVVLTKRKDPFSVRHPKVHKHWRGVRKVCTKTRPYIDFAGSVVNVVANITTAIRVR